MQLDLGIVRYANDNAPFTCSSNLIKLLSKFKTEVCKMYKWFQIFQIERYFLNRMSHTNYFKVRS